ncbi:MAG: SirB1 family protein [Phycisphaerae bacterium]
MQRHPFDLLMELPEEHIRLDCAALHLARDEYPALDVTGYRAQLDALAEEVAAERPGLASTLRYRALHHVLVERHGFRGNERDYYDPENSYLNRVLDRRVGIPISLAVVWIEVGRRLKWPVAGVNFPGHFLVRIDDPDRFVLVDAFGDGRSLSLADCRRLFAGDETEPSAGCASHFEPVDTRTLLSRMLNNLRVIYATHQDWPRLERVLARLVAVQPRNSRHWQELAALHFRRGDADRAAALLHICRQLAAGDSETATIARSVACLRAAVNALN